jgi:small subunit ribosomal protein S1
VITELTEGETRHGQVTSITNFGAFVDLGGADGLIHVSELSWGRVDNPRQVLKVGDEVDVYVLDVDRERKRIALSLKKLQPDPWTIVDDHYRVGELVEGRVTRVLDFGAFVELDLGIEGLLHTSEMIGTPELPPSDIVHPGEKLLVKIIRIESRRRRLALSARQVRKSEWERWIAEQQTAHEAEEAKAREEAARVREAKALEQAAPVPEAEALEQAAPVQETEASISEPVEVEREAESATEAEAIAPEEEAPVGKVVEEAAPASEPEMEEAIPSETEKVAPDEGTDVDSGIQAPEVADGAQAAD